MFEREKERDRETEREGKRRLRYKMSVAYLFIERAHIGTHGHMLACTPHKQSNKCIRKTLERTREYLLVLAHVSLDSARKHPFENSAPSFLIYLSNYQPEQQSRILVK